MKENTFQKALVATARVACCIALLGCETRTDTANRPKDTPTERSIPTKVEPFSLSSASNPEPAKEPESTPVDAEEARKKKLGECQAHINAVFTTKKEPESTKTKECCQFVADQLTRDPSGDVFLWAERNSCCKVLGWKASVACTPWGPPCPPAMPTKPAHEPTA